MPYIQLYAVVFKITDMFCAHCAAFVSRIKGITSYIIFMQTLYSLQTLDEKRQITTKQFISFCFT